MRAFTWISLISALNLALAAPTCKAKGKTSTAAAPAPTSSGTSSSGSGSGSGSTTPSNSTGGSNGTVALAWFAGYHADVFPISNISWNKYTAMNYFVAVTAADGSVTLESSDQTLLPQFVQAAHSNNVKAILTVGGWTGSQYFSSDFATDSNRTAAAQTMMKLVQQYSLDGLDFDWEYPNAAGIGCNVQSTQDPQNFLSFLQELRKQPGADNLTLSAATGVTPWAGVTDLSGFASVLDYIEIMNYDVYGPGWSSVVGPNSPLNDTCMPSNATQAGSAVSAVAAWSQAGFPANQIVLGVPSYGHGWSVSVQDATGAASASDASALVAYPSFNKGQAAPGDKWAGAAGTDVCGNATPAGGTYEFWGLVDNGFLNGNGTVAQGKLYRYDECTQTPYVYDPTSQVMVAYDDATSFAAKGAYIKSAGLKGFALYETGGDYNDILLDAITGAVGSS
ncbi:glycoside hydrolase family 18 protein [Coniophora puteana RWD-64-598 SS2]|uniref:Glycoside hydrolase family 18 protein n=1 Tax=Coniophora puteana (strain RWD-64-598) TaxID=741705 RepID=A0A5M3MCT7_CONPW|nr:glycoside hydrolase family 18 protein [Coniophora puteana RWD-64-598 SS2]EIW77028.1 glycoside hydrolase family 18 protein [Coniophora puteana RWD-64-598 SS2]